MSSNWWMVDEALFYSFPHQGERPLGMNGQVSLIVMHSIGLPPGEYGMDCVNNYAMPMTEY